MLDVAVSVHHVFSLIIVLAVSKYWSRQGGPFSRFCGFGRLDLPISSTSHIASERCTVGGPEPEMKTTYANAVR